MLLTVSVYRDTPIFYITDLLYTSLLYIHGTADRVKICAEERCKAHCAVMQQNT